MDERSPCLNCGATGKVPAGDACRLCDGKGHVEINADEARAFETIRAIRSVPPKNRAAA